MAQFQTIEFAEQDGFGIAAFGTSYFGGAFGRVWTLPPLQVPSTNPEDEDFLSRDGITHRRRDAVVGYRHYATRRKYRIAWSAASVSDMLEAKEFYKEGRFYFVPDEVDGPENKVKVFWDGDFRPTRLRGAYWQFDFMLEEVL